jgi:prepilin-type N-terminal cleavage/methylation domain-containing protein
MSRQGFTLVELMIVIAILGLLVGVLAVAIIGQYERAQAGMEKVQMTELYRQVQALQTNQQARRTLSAEKNAKLGGAGFWSLVFRTRLLDADFARRCVNLRSSDLVATGEEIEKGELKPHHFSYTAPRAGQLSDVLALKGGKRVVVITFNVRNWNTYGRSGVCMQFSDGDTADFLSAELAREELGVERADWDDPAKLLGSVKPFQFTHDDAK